MNREIPCPICGEKQVSLGWHARKHGMSAKEFKARYGYLSYKDQIVSKISDLYISRRNKWVLYLLAEQKIITISRRALTDNDIYAHLEGKAPVGIHTPKRLSKWLVFDVDSATGIYDAAIVTSELVNKLEQYFNPEDIHIVFSGGKGYHVALFFDKLISNSDLVAFAKEVTIFNQGNPDVNIEYRPESDDGKAIKLPLTKHFRTGDFCPFVDRSFRPIPDPHDYLMSIRPITPIDFKVFSQRSVLGRLKQNPAKPLPIGLKEVNVFDEAHLAKVWQNGLPEGGKQRNRHELPLAIWLKDQGYDKETVKNMLLKFTDREHKAGRTKDSASTCRSEINATVDKTFDNNLSLSQQITPFLAQAVSFLPKKAQATIAKIICLCKINDTEGYTFLAPKGIGEMLGKSRPTIYRHIDEALDKLLFRVVDGEHKEHMNSLYFSPLSVSLFGGEFIMPIDSPSDFNLLVEYAWYRHRLGHILANEILYKDLVLKQNELSQLPEEVRRHVEAYLRQQHQEYVNGEVRVSAEYLLLVTGIYEIEQYLTGKKAEPKGFSELLLGDTLNNSAALNLLRELYQGMRGDKVRGTESYR